MVYKLVAVKLADGSYQPKMKISDSVSKAIIPGKKMPWRLTMPMARLSAT